MAGQIIELTSDALPATLRASGVKGIEEMNGLPRWEVGIVCDDAAIDFEAAVGAPATLTLSDAPEGSRRVVGLVVTNIAHEGEGRDGHHYVVHLSAPPWLLGLRAGFDIFQDKTTQQIVAKLFEDAGIPADQLVWRLSGKYLPRQHCTRYGETALAFVDRLLADEGIAYWFDFTEEKGPFIVFGDDAHSHEGIASPNVIYFADASAMVAGRHFFDLEHTSEVSTTRAHVREYDIRAPDVLIEGKAGGEGPEYFEYPARTLNRDAAEARAKVRLEQLRRLERRALGKSNCIRIQPGRLLEIDGCSDGWMNGRYLVVRVEHEASIGGRNDADVRNYSNRVVLVPATDVAFRPDLPRSRPRASGLETAMTTGPTGQEIHVDDLGRVKVRFPWDRANIDDDRSSYWVRCLQMGLGNSMLLPRVGWEVPVGYIDGDPDRPFVFGRTYNATAVVPYALPGGSATTSLQSATSPGGGTTNEIRMGDSGGKQELFMHASRDQVVTVGGSATTSVSVNETHDVTLAYAVGITGSQTLTVGGSQSVDVGMDYSTGVDGGRTEIVGGLEINKITANRKVVVSGGYTELIGGFYGIQSNQSNTTVAGAFTQLIGGGLNVAAGLGAGESVAAARTEIVGGSRSINAAKAYADKVMGVKSVTAGAVNEKAGGIVSTDVKAAGSVKVGGSAKISASGRVTLSAPEITIDVGGSIKAGALKLGGGTLTAKSGATLIEASTITRSGGSKISE